ncbi:TPA: hypothetical protein DD394_07875 [bacterium UBP9_UBA11836]|nr:hypothetical protein [bacterium UBP9_UBA11836]
MSNKAAEEIKQSTESKAKLSDLTTVKAVSEKESESTTVKSGSASRSRLRKILFDSLLSIIIVILIVPFLFLYSKPKENSREIPIDLTAAKIDFSSQNKDTHPSSLIAGSALRDSLASIQKQYIREVSTAQLVNGALEGINYCLDKFGHRDLGVAKLDETKIEKMSDKELLQVLDTEFEQALARIAKLPENQRFIHRRQLEKAIKTRLAELDANDKKAKGIKADDKKAEKDDIDSEQSLEKQVLKDPQAVSRDSVNSDKTELDTDDSEIIKDADGKPVVLTDTYLLYSALNGMICAINDPFSMALPPEDVKILQEQLGASDYGGVGIYLEADWQNNRQLTVIEPIEGTPAALKDVRPGDKIMAIDGKKTSSLDMDTAAAMIRGKVGSTVVLSMQRDGKNFEVALQRTSIHVPSVNGKMLPNDIGYLRVRFFGSETTQEFGAALNDLVKDGAKALIVDLRNNGGGYIDAAIGLCSEFLPNKSLVTSVVNPRLNYSEPYFSNSKNSTKLPLVVLVNRFSASASEITSGAMKDYRRALIVGETTYGKGSVQGLQPFSDGGALKITIAHYLTPKDKDIHLKGIKPDIAFESRPTNKIGSDNDLQLKLAIREAQFLVDHKLSAELSQDDIKAAQQEGEAWKKDPTIAKLTAVDKAEEAKLRAKIEEEIKKDNKITRDVQ